MGKTKKLLSIGAAAKIIGVSVDTLRNWDESGTFRSIREEEGKMRRYDQSEVYIRARARQQKNLRTGLNTEKKTMQGHGFVIPPALVVPTNENHVLKNFLNRHFFQNKKYRYLKVATALAVTTLFMVMLAGFWNGKIDTDGTGQYVAGATQNKMSEIEKRLINLEQKATQPLDSAQIFDLPIPGNNLIRNSSFEAGNGVAPRQWHYQLESDTSNTFRTKEGIRSGEHGLKIVGGGDGRYGISQPTVKTRPGSTYTFSAYVKNTNLTQPATIKIGFWDEYGNKRGKEVAYTINTTGDWSRIHLTATTPGLITDTVNWFPLIEVSGLFDGQLYIDDVMLTESGVLTEYASSVADWSGSSTGLGDGSVLADPDGNFFPALTGKGSLGIPDHAWNGLHMTNATINEQGDMTLGGDAHIKGDLSIDEDLSIGDDVTISNALTVNGNATLGNASNDTLVFHGSLLSDIPDNSIDAFDVQEASNDYINVSTVSGSEKITFGNTDTNQTFVFAGSGSLGIGTTAPSYTLDVTGTGHFTGALTLDSTLSMAGLTNTGAFTTSGGIASLNASSNFATNINTGTSTGAVSIGNSLAGALTLASGAASSFTTTSADLTLGTVTSGTLALTSAGAVNTTAGANSTTNVTGTYLIDSTGALSFNTTNNAAITTGTGAISLNGETTIASGKNLNLTAGNITLSSGLITQTGSGNNSFAGNVGVGTTNPLQKLHVVGQCVTGDTKLRRRRRKKRKKGEVGSDDPPCDKCGHAGTCETCTYWEEVAIKDIEEGDEIQTLDEKTGEFVTSKVNALMDMGTKDIFTLTTSSGKTIRTTGNHPYLAKKNDENDNKDVIDTNKFYNLSFELINQIAKKFYFSVLVKQKIYAPALDDAQISITRSGWKHLHYEKVRSKLNMFSRYVALPKIIPLLESKEAEVSYRTKGDVEFWSFEGIVDDVLVKVIIRSINNGAKHLYSVVWKGENRKDEEATKNGAVFRLYPRSRGLVTSQLHTDYTRFFADLSREAVKAARTNVPLNIAEVKQSRWTKVKDLYEGIEIATIDGFEKIVKIEKTKAEQVWDIEVENTHNFVGNGIVAHNTYLQGAGTTTGFSLRTADSTGADKFAVLDNGNVGIGTTDPSVYKLNVNGNTNITGTLNVTSTVTGGAYNGLTLTSAADGYTITGGTTPRTLTVTGSNITLTGGGNTLTLAGALTTANAFTTVGNYALTLTQTGTTNVTLPTTGTLATLSGVETLANKTLTSPIITTSPTASGATWTDLGSVTTADINGGTIDGTTIGGSSSAGAIFTTLTSVGTANINATGTAATNIGNSTGVLTLASGGASGWTNTSGDLTLRTATSGNILLNSIGNVGIGGTAPSTSPYLFVGSTGNVGIGTTNPTAILEINGSLKATSFNGNTITTGTGTLTLGAGKTLTATDTTTFATNSITLGGGEVITFSASNALSLLTTGTTSVTLPTSGTLYGTATDSISSAQLLASLSDETGTGLSVFNASPTITNPVIANIAPGADFTLTQNSVIPFTSVNTGAVANTLYLKAGNVGIGTTSPTSKLSVGASSEFQVNSTGNIVRINDIATSFPSSQGVTGSVLTNSDGAGTLTWASPSGSGAIGYWTRTGTNLLPTTAGDDLYLGTNELLGVGYDPATISGGVAAFNGNVGIGTTNPTQQLTVFANAIIGSSTSSTETLSNTGFVMGGDDLFVAGMAGIEGNVYTDGSFIAGASTTYGNGSITQSSGETLTLGTTSANLTLSTATSGNILLNSIGNVGIGGTAPSTAPYLFVGSTGNVGIGTTGPGEVLDVVGNIKTSGTFKFGTIGMRYTSSQVRWDGGSAFPAGYNFMTNSVQTGAMVIQDNGNVGIGTTGPLGTLDIKSAGSGNIESIRLSNISNTGDGIYAYSGTPTHIFSLVRTETLEAGSLSISAYGGIGLKGGSTAGDTTNTADLFIKSNGNVGIGTTGPGSKLHIAQSSDTALGTDSAQSLRVYNAAGTSFAQLRVSSSGVVLSSSSGGAADLPLYLNTSRAGTPPVTITTSGNVGIGTTGPTDLLHVAGQIRANSGLEVGLNQTINFNTYYSSGFKYRNTGFANYIDAGSGIFGFYTAPSGTAGNATTLTERMRLSNAGGLSLGSSYVGTDAGAGNMIISGNVGIGTTAPNTKLQVSGSSGTAIKVGATDVAIGDATEFASFEFGSLDASSNGPLSTNVGSAGTRARISAVTEDIYGVATGLQFYTSFDTGSDLGKTTAMRITSAGNVGIGTTNPGSYRLNVNGNTNITGTLNVSSTITGGTLTDGTATLTSGAFTGLTGITSSGTIQFSSLTTNGALYTSGGNGTLTTTAPTTGTLGYWQRNSTYVSPATITDYIGIGTTAPIGPLQVNNGATPAFVVTSSGNIGIGTTGPQVQFETSGGTARIIGAAGGGAFPTTGDGLEFAFDQTSATSYIQSYDRSASAYRRLELGGNPVTVMSGNVGIGTTAPGISLNIDKPNGATAQDLLYLDNSHAAQLSRTKIGYLNSKFYIQSANIADSTQRDILLNPIAGNVGIGTTGPGYKLDIGSASSGGVINLINNNYDTDWRLRWSRSDNTGTAGLRAGDSSDNGGIEFWTGTTAGSETEKVRISKAGNVGIGTTGPGSLLHLYKASASPELLRLESNSNPTMTLRRLDSATNAAGNIDWRTSDGTLKFQVAVNSLVGANTLEINNGTENLAVFNTSGNVGIGTTAPGAKLEVYGNVGRFAQITSSGSILAKSNDNSVVNTLTLENTQNNGVGYGAALLFNLGYDGSTTTLGTTVSGGKIAVINEQVWTSTAATQDSSMQFQTALNGVLTDQVRITSTGNVGIGTTGPGAKLDVQSATGNVRILSTTGTNDSWLNINNTGGNFYLGRDSSVGGVVLTGSSPYAAVLNAIGTYPMQFGVNNAVAMTILNSGNVGIGTTAPGAKLDVAGSILTAANGTSATFRSAATNYNAIRFDTPTGAAQQIYVDYAGTGADQALVLGSYAGRANQLVLATNGNVGIGTTAPGKKLSVQNSAVGTEGIALYRNTGDGTLMAGLAQDADGHGEVNIYNTSGVKTIQFRAGGTGSYINSGNVGIGTTGPGDKLEVKGVARITRSDAANYLQLGAESGIGKISAINPNTATYNQLAFSQWNSTTEREVIRIDIDGNVGIGTTAPGAKLDVAGNFWVESDGTIQQDGVTGEIVFNSGTFDAGRAKIRSVLFDPDANQSYQDGELAFYTTTNYSGGLTEQVRIDKAGNVGIGTTAPGQRLSVKGAGLFGSTDAWVSSSVSAGTDLAIQGNVGIGTTSPGAKLDIRSSGAGSDTLGTGQLVLGLDNPYWTFRQSATALSDLAIDRYYSGAYSEVMRIQRSSGNVGIGTTGPDATLDVVDNISTKTQAKIRRNSTTTDDEALLGFTTSTSALAYNAAVGVKRLSSGLSDLIFKVAPTAGTFANLTEYMRITNAGNVGIGTTSPGYKLQVHNTTGATSEYITTDDNLNTLLGFISDFDGTNRIGAIGMDYSENNIKIVNGASFDGSSNGIVINTSGNVGIGTTGPGANLDVYGATALAGTGTMQIRGMDTTSSAIDVGASLVLSGYHTAQTSIANFGAIKGGKENGTAGNYASYLGLFTRANSAALTEQVRITSTGNVGIGTTAPGAKLDVRGTTGVSTSGLRLSTAGGSFDLYPDDSFGIVTTTNFRIDGASGLYFGSGGYRLYQNSAGVFRTNADLIIDGNVGIGTTGPGAVLDVNGATVRFGTTAGVIMTLGTNSGSYSTIQHDSSSTDDLIITNTRASSGGIRFRTAGSSDKVTILNSGNVGIGTTNPAEKLTVSGDGAAIAIRTVTDPTNYFLKLTANYSAANPFAITTYFGAEPLAMYGGNTYIGSYGKQGAVVVQNVSGNVGIGTTGPGALLDVSSGGLSLILGGDLNATTRTNATSKYGRIGGYHYTNAEESVSIATYLSDGTDNILYFGGGTSTMNAATQVRFYTAANLTTTTGTEAMRITSTGKVGIGTTVPTAPLHIKKSFATDAMLKIENNAVDGYSGIDMFDSGSVLAGSVWVANASGVNPNALTVASRKTGQPLYLAAGGYAPQVTLLSTGNVGIGTTGPTNKLEVASGNIGLDNNQGIYFRESAGGIYRKVLSVDTSGNMIIGSAPSASNLQYISLNAMGNFEVARFTASSGNRQLLGGASSISLPLYSFIADTNTGIYNTAADKLGLVAGGTESMTITSGNVGIGTTGPGAKLDVAGSINLTGGIAGGTTYSGSGNITSTAGVLTISGTGNSTIAGNVGIGTTGPNTKLEIASTTSGSAPTLRLSGWNSGAGTMGGSISFYENNYDNTEKASIKVVRPSGGTLANLTFSIGSAEAVRIDNNGNVGIGTTGPGASLDIKAKTSIVPFRVEAVASTNNLLTLGTSGSSAVLSLYDSSGNIKTSLSAAGDSYFTAGNVGIGTTNPLYALDVKASGTNIARFNGSNSTGCTLSDGGIIACSSDLNLKKNITDTSFGLDAINALRPVEFNWKSNPDGTSKNLGFIAQEVEQIIPKLVSTDENGYKQLNTVGFVPILTRAIQELSQSTDGQNIEMEMTNNRLLSLESTIELNAQGTVISVNDTIVAESDPTTIIFDRQEVVDLNKRLSTVEAALATKADISAVEDLRTRITTLEGMAMTASMSASLDSIIDYDLTVLGRTNVNDLGVTGTITSGLLSINGLSCQDDSCSATISTLSGPLRLQHLASAPVEIMGGKVTIDEKGNVKVAEGNLTLSKGKVKAPEVQTEKLTITTPATATSSAVLAASIGKVVIPAGDTVGAVKTSALTPDSQIFMSSDLPISMGRKKTGVDTFEITLQEVLTTELEVSWWIVN